MRRAYTMRVRILAGAVVLIALVLIGRLYMLQVVRGYAYRNEANQQYVSSSRNLFDRGAIFFTEKNGNEIAAASVKAGFMLVINPNKITDAQSVYRQLAEYTPLDRELFLARAGKQDDPYEEVAHHVSDEAESSIVALNIPGVQLFREHWRYYPGGSLAAHVLGFVGYSNENKGLNGRTGLERYWGSVLSRASDQLYVNFFAEVFANVKDTLSGKEHTREGDLVTTIEPSVQHALEGALDRTYEEWQAKQIGGIIINPQTGAIYALGALPTYDPNNYADVKDANVFRDPLVEDVYEMGSIIKPLAMAIGLDTGAVTAQTTYNDTGSVVIDKSPIRNWDGRARGVVDMQQVLSQSLNVGMAFVAQKVGGDVLGDRMRALGFGEETGIDLPFEAHGLVENLKSPREVEYATAAFGQGIALTPIETVRALCALGNGGYLVTPYIVKSIKYTTGEVGKVAPDDKERVYKPETSAEITKMLVTVVDEALRHGGVKKDHYAVAAKTGTAQIAKKGARGYYEDRYLHSFFGYFPAYDPKFLIFLYHVEPQGAPYASETLTTPFYDLVDFLINYYDVPPDR